MRPDEWDRDLVTHSRRCPHVRCRPLPVLPLYFMQSLYLTACSSSTTLTITPDVGVLGSAIAQVARLVVSQSSRYQATPWVY